MLVGWLLQCEIIDYNSMDIG